MGKTPPRKAGARKNGVRARPGRAASSKPAPPADILPDQFVALRDLFWHNVVREMLCGLMVVSEKKPDLLDGRFAVLTHGGERIPIAQVTPVFGMSLRGTSEERQASEAVQMTVFRVATPDGEVFTLPVHEVRGFQELTPELLARIQQAEALEEAAAHGPGHESDRRPFGFAAFQALPRLPMHVPEHPTE